MKAAQCGSREDETAFGGSPPPPRCLARLCSGGPASASASEVLDTPLCTLQHPAQHPAPPAIWRLGKALCPHFLLKSTVAATFILFNASPTEYFISHTNADVIRYIKRL